MKPPEMTAEDCRAVLAGLGLTRTGLARLLGLDAKTLARAERGEGRFAQTYRLLLAALELGVGSDTYRLAKAGAGVLSVMGSQSAAIGYLQRYEDLLAYVASAADGRSRPRGRR